MAKKTRKKSAAKSKKKSPKKSKAAPRKKTKPAVKRKKARKAKRKTIGGRIASAYKAVVDTMKETDRLRSRLEPPGTSETE